MAAAKGNNYHEKWTRDKIKEILEYMLYRLIEEKKSKKREIYLFEEVIEEATEEFGIPSSSFYYNINERFSEDKELESIKRRIDDMLLVSLFKNSKDLPPAMSVMTLKNKFHWKDRQEVDQNINQTNYNFEVTGKAKKDKLKEFLNE